MSSLADLHEALGKCLADELGNVATGNGGKRKAAPSGLRDLQIDACARMPRPRPEFHNEAFGQALKVDWKRTEAACELAFISFRQHRNPARYRAEVNAITGAS